MNLLTRRGVTYARANWGRWIGDCPSPFCASALQLVRNQPWFRCRDCDATAEVVWPPTADDIERLLMMRPDETTRNWEPGETLFDLHQQNIDHGVLPWDLGQVQAGATFAIWEDRILTSSALLANRSRQLTEGR